MQPFSKFLRLVCLLSLASATLSSCQLGRFVFYNFANITDYKIFPSRPLTASAQPFRFQTATTPRAPKKLGPTGKEVPLDQYLADRETVAFLIIQNDTIQYEQYFNGYEQSSTVASFSMAKSVTSMLIGTAVEDGLIKSVDEPITHYLPELKKNGLENVTIRHVLQMTSGIEFNESYVNPFGDAASFYYGRNLRQYVNNMQPKAAPGQGFDYISGNTQILGAILDKVVAPKTVTQYLQERIWQHLGMEYDASWSLDKKKDGLEKTFCCLNARARDFAKLGRLYLKQGNWNGRQVVPAQWVKESTQVDTSQGSSAGYQYQWWLPSRSGDFMMQGILGQFVYVNPMKNLLIVRLGKDYGNTNWPRVFTELAAVY
ncbi:serine hydrolase domain-containing protein [Rufibacter ruber]|uniref:serine hydrolase domain-containing protein n=1 Tax=Rufibacter ruber TaxID=1783499 RepID=UPI00082D8E44|nr:serine hydrolase [Rufibacter ruber]